LFIVLIRFCHPKHGVILHPAMMDSQRRLRAWAAALGLGLATIAIPGWAVPDPATPSAPPSPQDAITQLLSERGYLAPTPTGFVQSMRESASDMVLAAVNFLGVPYRHGGTSAESGFDCSGFTRYVFEMSIGMVLPRRAAEQAKSESLQQVKRNDLKPGDLVFFNTMRRAFSHVGIYVGDGNFIHAPRTGGKVRIESMREAYWSARFNGARRAALPQLLPQAQAAEWSGAATDQAAGTPPAAGQVAGTRSSAGEAAGTRSAAGAASTRTVADQAAGTRTAATLGAAAAGPGRSAPGTPTVAALP
jgi:cell wall-associated NlpC family hydrolase